MARVSEDISGSDGGEDDEGAMTVIVIKPRVIHELEAQADEGGIRICTDQN